MILIFEGCDRVGKTTFINEWFGSREGYMVKHFGAPPKELPPPAQQMFQENTYWTECDWLAGLLDRKTFPCKSVRHVNYGHGYGSIQPDKVVYDRFFIGDLVYAPIYRGYTPDYIEKMETYLDTMRGGDVLLVLVEADVPTIQSRYDGDFIKYEDIEKVVMGFQDAFYSSKLRKIRINPTLHGSGTCINQIMAEAEAMGCML